MIANRRLVLTGLAFANMLNEMRLGKLTSKSIEAFRALNRPLGFTDDFEATELWVYPPIIYFPMFD